VELPVDGLLASVLFDVDPDSFDFDLVPVDAESVVIGLVVGVVVGLFGGLGWGKGGIIPPPPKPQEN
jgi:hypothetical protein